MVVVQRWHGQRIADPLRDDPGDGRSRDVGVVVPVHQLIVDSVTHAEYRVLQKRRPVGEPQPRSPVILVREAQRAVRQVDGLGRCHEVAEQVPRQCRQRLRGQIRPLPVLVSHDELSGGRVENR